MVTEDEQPRLFCIACGGKHVSLADMRAHALALRDEGATHVSVDGMSVTFGPRPMPPLTVEAIAKELAKEPEPAGEDAYIP